MKENIMAKVSILTGAVFAIGIMAATVPAKAIEVIKERKSETIEKRKRKFDLTGPSFISVRELWIIR